MKLFKEKLEKNKETGMNLQDFLKMSLKIDNSMEII